MNEQNYTKHKGIYLPKAKTNPATTRKINPKVVNIVEGFKDRSRKDIDKWRKAILFTQLQDKPRFQDYHDLIDDLLTDGHLQSQITLRLSSTLNTDFHVLNRRTGEENEDLTHVFRQQWFFEVVEEYLMSVIRGFKLIEFASFEGEKIKTNVLPQRHVIPTQGKIIPDLSNPDGFIDFTDKVFEPWLLKLNKPYNLGILNNIVPALIWKRNVEQSWAEFCERFGIPLITATTPARDAGTINDVHDMLIGVGEASVGTFPQGTEIQFHEANRTDAFKVYKEFINLNMDQVSKQLVGSTMLSDQGTNRSQTEVHERGLDDKIAASDKRAVQFMVNDQLLPLLRLHGYNISDDDVFEFKTAEQEVELDTLWNITSGLLNQGFNVEQQWISKTFNIPIEGARVLQNNQDPEKKKNKPNERVTAKNRYPSSCLHTHAPVALGDKIQEELKKLTKELALGLVSKTDINGILGKMIVAEALELSKALHKGFKTPSSYTGQDNLVLQMMEYNVFDFAASKAEARHYAVAKRLIDYENGTLKSKSDFLQQCLTDNEMLNTNYLRTEYDTAIATGQNSAAYVRQLKDAKEKGQRYVQYQTIGDNAVRSAHKALDGKVFDLLEDGNKSVYPPNGYNCRCEFVPYTGNVNKGNKMAWEKAEGVLANSDKYYTKNGFNINRGDLKQVFTQKQFYSDIKGLPNKINAMSFDKYGLKNWSDLKGKYPALNIDKTITHQNADELFKTLADNKKIMGFKDYLGRKLVLRKTTFNRHKKRVQYFPEIKDVLTHPDEVWMTKHPKKGYQTNYIKHYKEKSLLVATDLNQEMEGIQIKTWFDVNYDNKSLERRKGLLIKNKER